MEIALTNGFILSSVRAGDVDDYVRLLGDGEVATTIPAIPQPFTQESAKGWVNHRIAFFEKHGVELCFAIRSADGSLAGSIGVDDFIPGSTHNGELGYWLGREFRGRGIAKKAARVFIPYAFDHLLLNRLTAHTLEFNAASIRVLEGVGFSLEGRLRQYTRTTTGLCDTLVFGLLKTEWITKLASNAPLQPASGACG
jgi:RimJ/RimL family protein N-acetyltransferase